MDIPLKNLNKLPHWPGVYIYRDKNKAVLYVGKALDLSRRVRQYFTRHDAIGDKTLRLVSQIAAIEIRTTPTEFDALLLEAQLIRRYLPKYNVVSRDDKSPLYVAMTLKDPLPRIFLQRKTQLQPHMISFGPFQSGKTARDLLSKIRHIIPFCTQKKRNCKPCFYTHIGLCDPCPSYSTKEIDKRRYRNNMLRIRDILAGKTKRVVSALQKEMEELAKMNQFEKADQVKRQVLALIALQTHRLAPLLYIQKDTDELAELRSLLSVHIPSVGILTRIECIDISNISGTLATGSLVVLIDGVPDTSQYRRFKVRSKQTPDDPAMIAEVVTRRFGHPEWPFPDLLVIDGGKTQIAAALSSLGSLHLVIPTVGLAKRFEEIIVPLTGSDLVNGRVRPIQNFRIIRLPLTNPAIHLLQRIRDEAHRFAKSYHLLIRRKLLSG